MDDILARRQMDAITMPDADLTPGAHGDDWRQTGVMHMEEDIECVRTEELNDIEDNLDYFDRKEEEHTLRQAERNNEVQIINKELALKESLVSELLKNVTQETAESRRNVMEMEQGIKWLHVEKEENLQTVHTTAHNISSK